MKHIHKAQQSCRSPFFYISKRTVTYLIIHHFKGFCNRIQAFFCFLFFQIFLKKGLTKLFFCGKIYIVRGEHGLFHMSQLVHPLSCLGVAQLVARYLGVVEAVGSSPVTQTIFVSQLIQCRKCTLERGCIFLCYKV